MPNDRVMQMRGIPVPQYPIPAHAWHDAVEFDWTAGPADEELVDIRDYSIRSERYYSRPDGWNWPYNCQLFSDPTIKVRKTVASHLVRANESLSDSGLEILVLDGHRSLVEQKLLWDFFQVLVSRQSRETDPVAITRHAARFCYDPSHFDPQIPATWPVHMTGGSVDLTIVRLGTAESLFMGGPFDDPSDVSRTAYYEATDRDGEFLAPRGAAMEARRVLWHSLEGASLVNYPAEWWHFDYGTSLWSYNLGVRGIRRPAFYRAVDHR